MRRASKRGPVRVSLGLTEMQAARVERAVLSPASRTRSQRLQELLERGLQVVEAEEKWFRELRERQEREQLGDAYLKSIGLGK